MKARLCLILTLTFLFCCGTGIAQKTPPGGTPGVGGWRYKPMVTETEIIGEVVDTWCYSSQVMGPGRGPKHKACGLACAHGGVTLGIVDDKDTLYIAAKHKGYEGCKDLLTPFVAKRVKVKGWLARRGGCNIMKISSVQEVGPKQKQESQSGSANMEETKLENSRAGDAKTVHNH